MQPRTPPLFATGRWVLDSPFSVPANAVYTCKAVRSFDDLKARGIDPYEQFYLPKGISRDDFENDVRNVANIVTLMSDTHPLLYVPDTYIKSYPDTTTVPYRHVVLSMSLGAIPDSLVLDDFKDKVQQYALASLGIEARVREHQAGSMSDSVDQITHQAAENNRLSRIENNQTEMAKLLSTQEELEKVREQNRILTDLCIDNGLLN